MHPLLSALVLHSFQFYTDVHDDSICLHIGAIAVEGGHWRYLKSGGNGMTTDLKFLQSGS